MKLAPRAVAGFLNAPKAQSRACLLYGPDSGLVHERYRALLKRLLPDTSDPFAFTELTPDLLKAEPTRLADECAALSLMGGARAIGLRDAVDAQARAVEQAVEVLQPEAYLIIVAGELTPRSSLRLMFEQKENLAALACYHDEAGDIQSLIRQRFEARGIRAAGDVVSMLAAELGNDRGITSSEIERIILYLGEEKELTPEVAETLMTSNVEHTLDGAVQAALLGESAELKRSLSGLWQENIQPIAVLRATLKQLQRLSLARAHMSEGKSADQAIAALQPPIFFKQQPPFRNQLQRWSAEKLARAIARVAQAELECKQAALDARLIAGHALLQLAMGARKA